MTTLELDGRITENGDLEVRLPAGLPVGEVKVRIDLPDNQQAQEEEAWIEEEIQAMMTSKRKSMQEVMAWLDAHPPTEEWGGMRADDDPAEYIHNLRRKNTMRLDEPEESE